MAMNDIYSYLICPRCGHQMKVYNDTDVCKCVVCSALVKKGTDGKSVLVSKEERYAK